jgi:hypothetical protein
MAGESGKEILRFRLTSIDSWNFAKLVELNISQNVINLCHLSSMPPSARFAVEEALTVLHHDSHNSLDGWDCVVRGTKANT